MPVQNHFQIWMQGYNDADDDANGNRNDDYGVKWWGLWLTRFGFNSRLAG